MPKTYLKEAEDHVEKIKYYLDYSGATGNTQVNYHYQKLGECYSKSNAKPSAETPILRDMYVEAGKQIDIMKRREEGTPTTDKTF